MNTNLAVPLCVVHSVVGRLRDVVDVLVVVVVMVTIVMDAPSPSLSMSCKMFVKYYMVARTLSY